MSTANSTAVEEGQLPTSILIVDGTNIENRCREGFEREDIDFRLFFSKVTAGTQLLRTHYFTAPLSGKSECQRQRQAEQAGRFNVLKQMANTTLHLGRYQTRTVTCRKCRFEYPSYAEKGTDVGVAVCLAEAAIKPLSDLIYLLAGDNDYVPALKLAKDQGAKVILGAVIDGLTPEHRQLAAISDLRRFSAKFVKLDHSFMSTCWRPVKTGTLHSRAS